jgi:hypothetical protein
MPFPESVLSRFRHILQSATQEGVPDAAVLGGDRFPPGTTMYWCACLIPPLSPASICCGVATTPNGKYGAIYTYPSSDPLPNPILLVDWNDPVDAELRSLDVTELGSKQVYCLDGSVVVQLVCDTRSAGVDIWFRSIPPSSLLACAISSACLHISALSGYPRHKDIARILKTV